MASSVSIVAVDDDAGRQRQRKRSSGAARWSDLPDDVLRLVVGRLYQVDRIRIRAVCKNWLATPINDIPPPLKEDELLPWLMCYRFSPHRVLCSFFEPHRKLPYVIVEEERSWDDERGWISVGSMLFRATVCASRCGWVLLSEKSRVVVNSSTLRHVYQYYVYNPFTGEIMSLPKLEMPPHEDDLGCLATFTSPPTSSDCVFIVPTVPHHADRSQGQYWVISTYSNKYASWNTHNHTPPVHAMAYLRERETVYYYNETMGLLSSFHIPTQEWKFLTNEPPTALFHLHHHAYYWTDYSSFMNRSRYIVAYGGHLHLVYLHEFDDDGGGEVMMAPDCKILKYDWLDGVWKRMDSLEGGVLFLGNPSFGVSAGEETRMVANRVYYFSPRTSTPEYLVYEPPPADQENSASCHSYLGKSSICSTNCMWMEPPLFYHSS